MAGKKRVPARMKAKQEFKPQGFTKKEWITMGIVVAAIILVVVGYLFLRNYFDGSLRTHGGKVHSDADWIVVNTGTTDKPKYFKLGTVSDVDGYTRKNENYSGDANVPTFIYTPNDTASTIENVTILAAKGQAEEMANKVSANYTSYLQNAVPGEITQMTIGDHTGWAFSCDYQDTEPAAAAATPAPEASIAPDATAEATVAPDATAAPEASATPAPVTKPARLISIYFDASHSMSVLASITAKADDASKLPSVDELYKALAPFVQSMTIDGEVKGTPAPVATASDTAASSSAVVTAAPTAEAAVTAEATEAAATAEATEAPAAEATVAPAAEATVEATEAPAAEATEAAVAAKAAVEVTAAPTVEATAAPTVEATVEATAAPTAEATVAPTVEATAEATAAPTVTPEPTPLPEGALPVVDGKVQAEANWIVAKALVSGSPVYYKLGEVQDVDGYTKSAEQYSSDGSAPAFFYYPAAADSPIANIRVTAASYDAKTSAESAAKGVSTYLKGGASSDIAQTTIAGRTGWMFSSDYENAVVETSTPAPDATATPIPGSARSVSVYFDAPKGLSIGISVTTKPGDAAALTDVASLTKMLEPFVQMLAIEGDIAAPEAAAEATVAPTAEATVAPAEATVAPAEATAAPATEATVAPAEATVAPTAEATAEPSPAA